MNVGKINNATNDLKDHVIGIIKVRGRYNLVCEHSPTNETVDIVRFTDFGIAISEYNLPTSHGQLILFPEGKSMNDMLNSPFEWADFIYQFEQVVK